MKCFAVVHSNNSDGMMVSVFYKEADARENMEDDVRDTEQTLVAQGYEAVTLRQDQDNVEVYVPDTSLSYQWSLIYSNIQ